MKLLLDVHIPAAGVEALRRKCPGLDVAHLSKWQRGGLREAEDSELLAQCTKDERMLVTYDLATIPALLNVWAEEGRDHGGVLLVDAKSLRPEKVGAVAAAIGSMLQELWGQETRNLVRFLRAGGDR